MNVGRKAENLLSLDHDTPMRQPDICTVIRDEDKQVIWNVVAYRKLTEVEAYRTVIHYLLNTKPRNRPKPGMTVTIVTVIGCEPGL
jgi:hypothetical protein